MDVQEEIKGGQPNRDTVRQALKLWDQTDELGRLPFAMSAIVTSRCQARGYRDSPSGRGLALRELLKEALLSLRPNPVDGDWESEYKFDLTDKRWRAYIILRERFVAGRNLAWIADQLHISPRTCQYEQTKALDLLTDRLRQYELRTEKHEGNIPQGKSVESINIDAEEFDAPAIFFAPPLPHYDLIGRQWLLKGIRHQLASTQNSVCVALHGLPGVGKSALAIALAHDPVTLQHHVDGVIWIGLGPNPDLATLLGVWGKILGVPAGELAAKSELRDRAALVQSTIGMKRLLLVIDDAWSMRDAAAFKVGGPHCSYLLTTRFPDIAYDFAGEGAIPVDELDSSGGLALVETLAPTAVQMEPAAVRDLVDAVGGLPLALTLMGKQLGRAALKAQSRRLRTTLKQLQKAEVRLILTEPQAASEIHQELPVETPHSLYAAIQLSDNALAPTAQQALRALALFPAKPNTFSEEAATITAAIAVETLDLLVDVALVESVGADRYTLHQTVADYARLTTILPETGRLFVDYFVAFAQRMVHDHAALAQELDNILTALELAYQIEMIESAVIGTLALIPFFEESGYLVLAKKYLIYAHEVLHSLTPPTLQMKVLLQLGVTLSQLGHYQAAHAHLEESLILAQQANCQQALADTYLALGIVYGRLGAPDKAQHHLEKALELFRQSPDHSGEIETLTGLGTLMLRQSHYPQAVAHFAAARAIAKQVDDRKGEIAALSGLGRRRKIRRIFRKHAPIMKRRLRSVVIYTIALPKRKSCTVWPMYY